MSEEGNKKELGVLVCILLKTESETRNRAQAVLGGVNCRKLSEDVGKETQGGTKSQYGVYQSGGYNCRQMGLSLIADPLKSHREHASEAIRQGSRNLGYLFSSFRLSLMRVGLQELHL